MSWMDLDHLSECSICMEREGYPIVVGCDHIYCERCIADWCTKHAAQCPICRLPVYGLMSGLERVVYLSPHNVPSWGLTVADQSRVAGKDVFRIDSVANDSIGSFHGLRKNQYVRFFGARDDPIDSLSEVESATSEAFAKKRLLKVETVSVDDGCGVPGLCACLFRSIIMRAR